MEIEQPTQQIQLKPTSSSSPTKTNHHNNNKMSTCKECSGVFTLPDLYVHGVSDHGVQICLICFNDFKFPKELMVHLHREHRVPPFKVSSTKEYLKLSGEGTTLLCVECNGLLYVDSDSDPDILSTHDCTKEHHLTGIPNSSKVSCSISSSTKSIETPPVQIITPANDPPKVKFKDPPPPLPFPPSTTPPLSRSLRPKEPPGQQVASTKTNESIHPIPSKQFQPPSLSLEPIKLKPLKKGTRTSFEPDRTNGNKSKPPITAKINLKLGRSIEITPANDDYYEMVPDRRSPTPPPPPTQKEPPMDPLLLEPDPQKRIEMLINDLAQSLSEIREEENMKVGQSDSDGPIELLISTSGTINLLSDADILTQMLDRSCNYCDYCRQAKLIRVDKRHLAIHLLSKHDWKIQFIRTAPEINYSNQLSEKKVSVDPETETKPIVVVENGSEIKEVEEKPIIELDANSPLTEEITEKKEDVMEIDEVDVKLLKKEVEAEQHSIEENEVFSPMSFFDFIQDEKDKFDMVPKNVQADKFRLGLLTSVFHSSELVYSYQKKMKLNFGLSSCQCLICGFFADTQLELFPHWRKAHRGMAMKCVMCHGKFLFAGALFSHLCLGTSQYFEGKSRLTPGTSTPLPVQSSQLADGGVEAESGNDTILLRYHCGICEDLELPGFFNYMVHLRKDHLRCELCLETVSSQKDLEHHMKKHKLNHFCWKCGVTYCAKPNFLTHLFWKHGTESRECSVCLKKKWPHIYHFCIPPQVFTCDVCGLYFTRSKALIVHKRLHTKNNLKSCPECPEKFVSKSLLQKHSISAHSSSSSQPTQQYPQEVEPVPTSNPAQLNTQLSFDLATTLPLLPDTTVQGMSSEDKSEPILSDINPLKMNGDIHNQNLSPKLINGEADHKLDTSLMETQDVVDGQGPELESLPSVPEKPQISGFETQPDSTKDQLGNVENGTLIPNGAQVEEKNESPKKKRNKKSKTKDAKFKLDSILGPNLSEDESSSGDESSASEPEIVAPVVSDTTILIDEKPKSIERLSETESDSDSDIIDGKVPANSKKDSLVNELGDVELSMPSLDVLEELVQSPPLSSETFTQLENKTEGAGKQTPSKNDLSALLVKPTVGLSPRLDLSSIATFSLLEHEKSFELPSSLPEEVPKVAPVHIPENNQQKFTLPDHITIENALLSIKMEHDYCRPELPSPSKHKRKSLETLKQDPPCFEPSSIFCSTKKLKMKSTLPASKLPEILAQKRKRTASSSSSSSSSSCGSNCSCSSSSSSSSSSDSSSSDSENSGGTKKSVHSTTKHSIQPNLELKIKKGRLPKAEKPMKVKKPKGRPPKANKKIKFMGKEQLPPVMGVTFGENEIFKHFDKPDDAFILEEDLDTEDSGSEDIFHRQQLTETISAVPSLIDEPWTTGNERFLLQEVRGVKELEELRPKPVVQPELQVKNPPIKSLIVRRSIGNELEAHSSYNENDTQEFVIGNTTIRGTGSFLTSHPSKTTLTITRAGPNSAMSLPASAKSKNNHKNQRKTLLPAPGLIPLNNNCSAKEESLQLVSSTTFSIGNSPAVTRPDSLNSELHNSVMNRSMSSSAQLTCNPTSLDTTPKPRKARTKITPRRQDKVEKVVISLDSIPSVPAAEVDDQLYCICRGPHDAVSQMIGCDAKDCQYQWFHFECVGVIVPPKGKWYCPDCKDKRKGKTYRMKTGESPNAAVAFNGPPRSKNVNGKT